jgi:flagellar assembly protein FliH
MTSSSNTPRKPHFLETGSRAGTQVLAFPRIAPDRPPPNLTVAPRADNPAQSAPLAPEARPDAAATSRDPASSVAQAQLARVSFAVAGLRAQAERLAEQARADAIEIGFQVARRILERELTTSPETLFSLVRSAIRRVGEARTVTIRLAPADLEQLEAAGGGERVGPASAKIELVADPTLSVGDCLVESELGMVDGRLETRLQELRRGIDAPQQEDVG